MKIRITIDNATIERQAEMDAMNDPTLLDDDYPDAVDALFVRYLDALEPLCGGGALVVEVDTISGAVSVVRAEAVA